MCTFQWPEDLITGESFTYHVDLIESYEYDFPFSPPFPFFFSLLPLFFPSPSSFLLPPPFSSLPPLFTPSIPPVSPCVPVCRRCGYGVCGGGVRVWCVGTGVGVGVRGAVWGTPPPPWWAATGDTRCPQSTLDWGITLRVLCTVMVTDGSDGSVVHSDV